MDKSPQPFFDSKGVAILSVSEGTRSVGAQAPMPLFHSLAGIQQGPRKR